MNRAIAIISNEEILEAPPFYRDIPDNGFHAMEIENFSKKYNLGITAESLGIEAGDYSGITWQKALVSLGHLVVCHGEPVVVYIPSALSFNQYEWFQSYKLFFKKNRKNLSYMVIGNQGEIVEKDDIYSNNNTFYFMYKAIETCRGGGGIIMQEESEELKR